MASMAMDVALAFLFKVHLLPKSFAALSLRAYHFLAVIETAAITVGSDGIRSREVYLSTHVGAAAVTPCHEQPL